jgi:hypothetical protein
VQLVAMRMVSLAAAAGSLGVGFRDCNLAAKRFFHEITVFFPFVGRALLSPHACARAHGAHAPRCSQGAGGSALRQAAFDRATRFGGADVYRPAFGFGDSERRGLAGGFASSSRLRRWRPQGAARSGSLRAPIDARGPRRRPTSHPSRRDKASCSRDRGVAGPRARCDLLPESCRASRDCLRGTA